MAAPDHFYITTTLPYVNARPHMGHAVEFVRADAVARYKERMGYTVLLNTGTDEHGLKIYRKALEEGREPKEYVDEYAGHFREMTRALGMKDDLNFVRTTDRDHMAAAQAFWRRCAENGDIYKKKYKVLYCVGCELEKTLSDLVDGECPDHPGRKPEEIDEENYFFRFSKYQKQLLDLYSANRCFVTPAYRLKEIQSFVERGLEDFSISRLVEKQPWGVPVPDDPEHTMYVWFDALVNYVSVIGWPYDEARFKKWWPVTQYAGKDNLRQQSAMWQAMLFSAGLPSSQRIIINGFVISGGQKMSKTIGNIIDPIEVINQYGTDALRYYILRELNPFEDSDMTMDRFKEAYNANLANGLGNLVSRVMKMAETHLDSTPEGAPGAFPEDFRDAFERFDLQQAADVVWEHIRDLDRRIQETEPFKLVKIDEEKAREIIKELVVGVAEIGDMLAPLMPETSKKIQEAVTVNRKPETLFERR